jgi:hypothetical protein
MAFWVVEPCNLVEVYRRFSGGTCCFHHHRTNDEGSKNLCSVGELLPDYTALQRRRQPSSGFKGLTENHRQYRYNKRKVYPTTYNKLGNFR